MSDSTPQWLGRFEVVRALGHGGMADAYVVRLRGEARFERLYAAKRIRSDGAPDPALVAMFFDEARIAARIHSPHVVSVLDVGRDDSGYPFMVMALVLGADLAALQETLGRLPQELALSILADVSQGLADAHDARDLAGRSLCVVHRDIKPSNILVGRDGRALITDFGLALGRDRETKTRTGELKGTFGYFSPEQVFGDADHLSDVFALGVVAWELLCGQRLFDRPTMDETLQAISSAPIPSVRELAPEVSPAVSNLVAAALERDRTRRLPSAHAFREQLLHASPDLASAKEELGALVASACNAELNALSASLDVPREELETSMSGRAAIDGSSELSSLSVTKPMRPRTPTSDPTVRILLAIVVALVLLVAALTVALLIT